MTNARELLAKAADELGYKADAQLLRKGGGAFIQVNAALRAVDALISKARSSGKAGSDAGVER